MFADNHIYIFNVSLYLFEIILDYMFLLFYMM